MEGIMETKIRWASWKQIPTNEGILENKDPIAKTPEKQEPT